MQGEQERRGDLQAGCFANLTPSRSGRYNDDDVMLMIVMECADADKTPPGVEAVQQQ